VRLTRTEFEIVRTLMAAPRRGHTKRALSFAAGGDAAALEDKTVATHIGNIRAKLLDLALLMLSLALLVAGSQS